MDDDIMIDLALFIVRITLGAIFLAHGLQKWFGLFNGPGIEGTTGMLSGLGFIYPAVWAWILALTETIGGLFLVAGIMPRLLAALIAVVVAVAIAKVHWSKGFFMSKGGFEYQLLLLAVCLLIILTGGGKHSLYNRL